MPKKAQQTKTAKKEGYAGALVVREILERQKTLLAHAAIAMSLNRQSTFSPVFAHASLTKKGKRERNYSLYFRLLKMIAIAAITIMTATAAIPT